MISNQELEALILDRSLGELPGEVEALLDAFLAERPDLKAIEREILSAVEITESTVVARPENFTAEATAASDALSPEVSAGLFHRLFSRSASRWALAAMLLGLAVAGGFIAGEQAGNSRDTTKPLAEERPEAIESPWARYRFSENGNLAVLPAIDPQS